MGLKRPDSQRLYSLRELITGRCTLGLPFREVSITLTGEEVAVVKAAVDGEGRGDIVSSFDSYLCFDEKLVQTLLWEPHRIQPTPETERDRTIRAHGGMFGQGWLRLLLDLAPEDATYSAQGLGTWVATAELAVELGFDDDATRDLLTHVAQNLNGKADPDQAPKRAADDDDAGFDDEGAPEHDDAPTDTGYPPAQDDLAGFSDGTAAEPSDATSHEPEGSDEEAPAAHEAEPARGMRGDGDDGQEPGGAP